MGKRLVYLDVMRAVAILLVIGHHQPEVSGTSWGATFFAAWKRCGWTGVDLFFCLSGFLIGGLLFDEFRRRGHIDLKRFYIRRAFKIWPSYLLFVAVAILAHGLVSHPPSPHATFGSFLRTCWPNFLHIQNYCGTPWQHTWSLAVEEHFYLVLPLLFLVLLGRKTDEPFKPIPALLVLVAIGCLALRLITARHRPFLYYRHIYPTHLRIDSLLAGVALAYMVHFRTDAVAQLRRYQVWLLPVGIACFVPTLFWTLQETPFLYTWGFSLLIVGSLCITMWSWLASMERRSVPVVTKLFAAVGAYSYSIYLWHLPFGSRLSTWLADHLIRADDPHSRVVLMTCFVGTSVVLGTALYVLVEWPMLAFRNRYFPSRSARPLPAIHAPVSTVAQANPMALQASEKI